MKAPPPEIIASWPEPDYVDPDYQGPQLLIVGVILLVVSCTVVGLRLWVRLHMKNSASWDDWIILSVIVSCAFFSHAMRTNASNVAIHSLLYRGCDPGDEIWMG
jgi:hypothetical protein